MLRRLLLNPLLLTAALGPATRLAPPGGPVAVTPLPAPAVDGQMSVEAALSQRRLVRAFDTRPLTAAELGQLLWAAQGSTGARGYRTAPSAGALYPLEVYVATAGGLYRYEPDRHALTVIGESDLRPPWTPADLDQAAVSQAPAVFGNAAIYERTAVKYGPQRSPRYVHLEASHAAQNLLLQVVAVGLGAVPIGAFDDDGVRQAMGLPAEQQPLGLIPVGQQ